MWQAVDTLSHLSLTRTLSVKHHPGLKGFDVNSNDSAVFFYLVDEELRVAIRSDFI